MVIERLAFTALLVLVFSIPWEKSIQIAGVGTLTKFIGAAALVLGVVAAVARKRIRLPNVVLVLAALFILWSGMTWLWSLDRTATVARAITLTQLGLMAFLIWDLCREARQQRQLIWAYVAGACVASVATIARYSSGTQTYYRRYAAPGFEPNDLGVTLALAVPLALYLLGRTRRWKAAAATGTLLLIGAAIVLTGSRTAAVAGYAAFIYVFFAWHRLPPPRRFAGLALPIVITATAILLAPPASTARISTVGQELTLGTLHNRTTIWKAGLKVFPSFPWKGVGAGAYPDAVKPLIGVPGRPGHEYVAHNSFLSVLVETGLIGFAIYGAMLLVLAISVWVMQAEERALWATVLLVWAIGVSTLTWEHRKPPWLLFALITTEWARSFREPNS